VTAITSIAAPPMSPHAPLSGAPAFTGGDNGAGSGGGAIRYERLTQSALRCVSVLQEVVVFSPPSIVVIDEISPRPGTCEDKVGACAVAVVGKASSINKSTV
jgi:hypothetical protein